jgi:hypothetical protein
MKRFSMKQLRRWHLMIVAALGVACGSPLSADPLARLLEQDNFTGWKVPEQNLWWTVEEGVLSGKSDPEQKGSDLWTTKKYGDFVLQLEFRMGEGIVDSGVFVRNGKEQIQIGESGSLKRDLTCSPYIAGKGYPVEAKGIDELLKPRDWNAMVVTAIGNHYSVWLNGRHVMSYESETAAKQGPIGLQIHPDRDMAIDFRNIRIGEL